jgi:excisionase family DNA binding protein
VTPVLESLEKLEQLAQELEERGETSVAKRIAQEVTALRAQTSLPKLMTTGEAAEALGIRSINTIKRWAQDGKLEGYRRGGRVLVSARSVAAMAESPLVAREHTFERDLEDAYAPFGFDEAEVPDFGDTWVGRKPWAARESARD